MAAGRGRWSGGAPGPPRLPGQPRSCRTDPGACWLLLRSHRPTAGGAATPAPSPGRFLPSLRVAPPRRAAPACVLRAHYTHRVTGPHRLPHGARRPRGALSASSSRHGSHLLPPRRATQAAGPAGGAGLQGRGRCAPGRGASRSGQRGPARKGFTALPKQRWKAPWDAHPHTAGGSLLRRLPTCHRILHGRLSGAETATL